MLHSIELLYSRLSDFPRRSLKRRRSERCTASPEQLEVRAMLSAVGASAMIRAGHCQCSLSGIGQIEECNPKDVAFDSAARATTSSPDPGPGGHSTWAAGGSDPDIDPDTDPEEPGVTVNLEFLSTQFYEGPYRKRQLDEAKLVIDLDDLDGDGELERTTVGLRFTGTATLGADYQVLDSDRVPVPPAPAGGNGVLTLDVRPDGNGKSNWYLRAVMDGDFEIPESVIVTIATVGANAKIGDPSRQTSTLIDGTGDLDIGLLDEDAEDDPGADVLRNDDDDNQNDEIDLRDSPLNVADNDLVDLVDLVIKSHLRVPHDYTEVLVGDTVRETTTYLVLDFNPALVRIYHEGLRVEPGITRFTDALAATTELQLEGVGSGEGTVTLQWIAEDRETKANYARIQFDRVKLTVWSADLDTNSDNTIGPVTEPDHSPWEDFIEDYKYGLGVIIYPTHPHYAVEATNHFQPATYTITRTEAPTVDQGIKFSWQVPGQSGHLRVWSVPSNVAGGLKDSPLEAGGHLVTNDRVYSQSELRKAADEGRYTPGRVWLEGLTAQSVLDQYHTIPKGTREDPLTLTLLARRNDYWMGLKQDRVKYLIANHNKFYPHLQWDLDPLPGVAIPAYAPGHNGRAILLRDAMAAGLVYQSGADSPAFALKKQTGADLSKLGLDDAIVAEILHASNAQSGLQLTVFRDYATVGAPVVLAFRGTDDGQDIVDDILQGLGEESEQYVKAIRIGAALAVAPGVREVGLRITGHSLGGGLASAASVAASAANSTSTHGKLASFHTNTFNAAGLHRHSLYEDNDPTKAHRVPGIVQAYNRERVGQGAIDSWNLEFDILSFVQDNSTKMPTAIGRRHIMNGPRVDFLQRAVLKELGKALRNFEGDSWDDLLDFYWEMPDGTIARFISVKDILINSHKTTFYYFGIMVITDPRHGSVGNLWDIYGDDTIHF